MPRGIIFIKLNLSIIENLDGWLGHLRKRARQNPAEAKSNLTNSIHRVAAGDITGPISICYKGKSRSRTETEKRPRKNISLIKDSSLFLENRDISKYVFSTFSNALGIARRNQLQAAGLFFRIAAVGANFAVLAQIVEFCVVASVNYRRPRASCCSRVLICQIRHLINSSINSRASSLKFRLLVTVKCSYESHFISEWNS